MTESRSKFLSTANYYVHTLMPNREYVAKERISSSYGQKTTKEILEDIVNFTDERTENIRPKFKIIREPSVRYPKFSIDVLLRGCDNRFRENNIDTVLDRPSDNELLRNGVLLSDKEQTSQRLMVISTSSPCYKTLLTLYQNKETTYSTRANIYDDVELAEMEGNYNLMYKIGLGGSVVDIGSELRSVLNSRTGSYVYELLDDREDNTIILDKKEI